MKSLICDIATNDADYSVYPHVNGKRVMCNFYKIWRGMIHRCHSEHAKYRYPAYKDMSVCEEWLTFSNFKKWMEQQDWKGNELDKDILYPNNKIYSPETCVFIPREVNSLFSDSGLNKGVTPKGVILEKTSNKYRAVVSINNKNKYLGAFDSVEEAHNVYLYAKIKHIKSFYAEVEPKVKKGLKRHVKLLKKELHDTIKTT